MGRLPYDPFRLVVCALALLTLGAANTFSTIVKINTSLDGNKLDLTTIQITSGSGNPDRTFSYDQLISAHIVDYNSIPENNADNTINIFGTPDSSPPSGTDRLSLLFDAALNTGISNLSSSSPGLTVSFEPPIVNGPSEDLVFFEFTSGAQAPDSFRIMKTDGTGTVFTVPSSYYQKSVAIPTAAALTTYLVTVGPGQSATLSDFINGSVTPSPASTQKWHAVPIDLDVIGLASGEAIGSLTFTSTSTSSSQAIDPLLIAGLYPYMPPVSMPGDYDGDGQVDAADYVAWSLSVGQTGVGLPADGSGPVGIRDGIVNDYDYQFWRSNFGKDAVGSSTINPDGTIPEPTNPDLLTLAAWCISLMRLRATRSEATCLAPGVDWAQMI
jgi:hypothetical protein